jgi:integrase
MAHLTQAFGKSRLDDIGALRIEQYMIERIRTVASATVHREIALLKHLYNPADAWSLYFGKNPVKGVKFLAENNKMLRVLSVDEEARLVGCCSPYLQDLLTFAINTGFRLGEILNLKWTEVDLDNATIRMLVKKNRRVLDMPVNEAALSVLRGWHGIRKCEYVFFNPETGGQWKDLWFGLKKACRKAGLDDVTWHTFRHTFASRLNHEGADLMTVKELLGHSDIKTTMRYAHSNREARRSAVVRLGANLVTPPVSKAG